MRTARLYRYPFCLGAYKEVLQGYGDNYCPYWLRDGIEKGDYGKNYVTCVASRPPDRSEATETEAVKCTVCGYIITPALGHDTHAPDAEWHFDATKHWHNCTGCSQKLDEGAHAFGDWTITVKPEVGVAGEKERECSVCGFKENAPVEALGDEQPGDEQPEKTGLSGGAIAGIAVGSVAVAGVGGFSVFWFVIKKKKFADLIAIFKKK